MYVLNRDEINKAIRRRGLKNLAEVARRIGVHRNSLGRYLSGQECVLPESVSKLLDFLGLDPGVAVSLRYEQIVSPAAPVEKLVDTLIEVYPKAAYVLFGSRARNTAKEYSDFDIGVSAREGLSLPDYLMLLEHKERFEEESAYYVDLVNLNNADGAFLKNILPDLQFLGGRHSDWIMLKNRAAGLGQKDSEAA